VAATEGSVQRALSLVLSGHTRPLIRVNSPYPLGARWTISSAASGKDVPDYEGDDDDRYRDGHDGDG
jgi:hypothetical protein